MGRLRSIQILRFIAAALVVWVHADGEALRANSLALTGLHVTLGGAGVDIFFVISGAIIYLTAFADRPMAAGDFLWRRLQRIVPLYFIISLYYLPFLTLLGTPISYAGLLTTFTFWPMWPRFEWPVLFVGWTLSFEMLFYMSATLALVSRRIIYALLAGFAGCWYARVAGISPVFQFLGNPIILEFLAGVAIAALFRCRTLRPASGIILILAAAAWLIIFTPPAKLTDVQLTLDGAVSGLRLLFWGVPAAALLAGALSLEKFVSNKWARTPVFLGDASYAIYLSHWMVMSVLMLAVGKASFHIPVPILTVLLSVAAIAFGCALYQYAERPLLAAWRGKIVAKRVSLPQNC